MMYENDENARCPFENTGVQKQVMATREECEDSCSRDSGFGDSMDTDSPTEFKTTVVQRSTSLSLKIMDVEMEMDDLDLEEDLNAKETKSLRKLGKRIGLANITNSPLVHESPKARTRKFEARGIQRSQTSTFQRKRVITETIGFSKRKREEDIDENEETIPSCSQFPSISFAVPKPRNVSIHRVHSTSVLEKGFYAHRNDDDQLPKIVEMEYTLPTLRTPDSQAYRRISNKTMVGLLKNMSDSEFNAKYILIDARYPYEYEGGHIRNAINLFNPEHIESTFYPEDVVARNEIKQRIPIMYCEYSKKRGPTMAQTLRGVDRKRNMDFYPHVEFPEIYVVESGYKGFFETFGETDQDACVPCSYTPMDHPEFSGILRKFSFHKKCAAGATAIRPPLDAATKQLMRRSSADSPSNRSSRRGLFISTPESKPLPLGPLSFS